jgi:hypothetical protein
LPGFDPEPQRNERLNAAGNSVMAMPFYKALLASSALTSLYFGSCHIRNSASEASVPSAQAFSKDLTPPSFHPCLNPMAIQKKQGL